MADYNLRKCSVCNNTYKYCNYCKDFNSNEIWRITFCSLNCKNIYNILSKYSDKRISAKDAQTELNQCNLSGLNNFNKSYKTAISNLQTELEIQVSTKAEKLVEETPITEGIVEATNDTVSQIIETSSETTKQAEVEEVPIATNVKADNTGTEVASKKNYRKSKKKANDVE